MLFLLAKIFFLHHYINVTKWKYIMDELSKEKLNNIKKAKNYTNTDIATLTNIPISSIDKIFSGSNKNPTIETLKKIAKVLDCTIDDFMNYEKEPVSPYYYDRQTAKIAEEIHKNNDLKILMDSTRDLSPEDINAIIEIAKRMKKNN